METLFGIDPKTGEIAWAGGKGKGSIIYADGMLYCYDERRGSALIAYKIK